MAGMVERTKPVCRVAALVVVLMSCGKGAGPEPVVVRDSAGIRIIENAMPVWREGTGRKVEQAPWLDIGLADGDSAFLFSRVAGSKSWRPAGSWLRTVAAARVCDEAGRHIRSFGRKGEGPGEFRQLLDLLGRSGDTLFLKVGWAGCRCRPT